LPHTSQRKETQVYISLTNLPKATKKKKKKEKKQTQESEGRHWCPHPRTTLQGNEGILVSSPKATPQGSEETLVSSPQSHTPGTPADVCSQTILKVLSS